VQSVIASIVASLLIVLAYASYTYYSNYQRSKEWTSIQFVLEDIKDAIHKRMVILRSLQDVEAILNRGSKSDLNVAMTFVTFDFGKECGTGSRFVKPVLASGWTDAKIRTARIEWLGGEIEDEINSLCSESGRKAVP